MKGGRERSENLRDKNPDRQSEQQIDPSEVTQHGGERTCLGVRKTWT